LGGSRVGAVPYPSLRQGMGWCFQILPYTESYELYDFFNNDPTSNSNPDSLTPIIRGTVLGFITCPSRRPATRYTGSIVPNQPAPVLTDYAAATPGRIWSIPGNPVVWQHGAEDSTVYWGGMTGVPATPDIVPQAAIFEGVIVRTPWFSKFNGKQMMASSNASTFKVVNWGTTSGGTAPTSSIKDGTSNTMVVGEKYLNPDYYGTGYPNDVTQAGAASSDAVGWAGGWGPDTICSTAWTPMPDSNLYDPTINPRFGSAHTSGFNTVFADASTHYIAYNIDAVVFDCLGNRQDGNQADMTRAF
jgi:hypothetical protein